MTTLDTFFNGPTDSSHPRIRNWKARLDGGAKAQVEVAKNESELGSHRPELCVEFTEDGRPLPLEVIPWDDELNAGLVRLGVRAANEEQEGERFSLGLRAALRKPEREFGDGYLNAVLIELIKNSDMGGHREIADVLKHAYALEPYRDGSGYQRCKEMIREAISGRAHELTEFLKYPKDAAKPILVLALGRYLDDRFSVTRRRRFGLL